MATVVNGGFEWDSDKAAENFSKHGVSFVEAMTVLLSDDVVELPDLDTASRLVTLGFSSHSRILFVVSTEVGERVRIISARRASPAQREAFAKR